MGLFARRLMAVTLGAAGAAPLGLALGSIGLVGMLACAPRPEPVDARLAEAMPVEAVAIEVESPPEADVKPATRSIPKKLLDRPTPKTRSVQARSGDGDGGTVSRNGTVSRPPPSGTSTPATTPSGPVQKLGPHAYRVERSHLETYTNDLSGLDELGWAARHQDEDGNFDGFYLGGIEPGSPLWELGLRPGDVVHSVNGRPVRTVPQVMSAWMLLQGADEIELVVSSRSGWRTLQYEVV